MQWPENGAHHPEDFLADSHLSHRVNRIKAQIITNGGRDIDAGSMVNIRRRSLITEYIACRISTERSHILPLRIAEFGS
jgi:hypothetical protein